MFPAPQNYICSPVFLFFFIFRLKFPYSPEINDIVPLFPIIPGRGRICIAGTLSDYGEYGSSYISAFEITMRLT